MANYISETEHRITKEDRTAIRKTIKAHHDGDVSAFIKRRKGVGDDSVSFDGRIVLRVRSQTKADGWESEPREYVIPCSVSILESWHASGAPAHHVPKRASFIWIPQDVWSTTLLALRDGDELELRVRIDNSNELTRKANLVTDDLRVLVVRRSKRDNGEPRVFTYLWTRQTSEHNTARAVQY